MGEHISREATYELMNRHLVKPTRSLGQNFLVNESMLDDLVRAAALTGQDLVVEIGPGLGHLTRLLAEHAGRVIAIEIDRHLLPALQETTAGDPNVTIIHADARKTDYGSLSADWPGPHKLVANLPYYITTPLITKALMEWPTAERLVLTIQDEATERILAKPGTRAYGPLAVLCQLYGTPVKQRIFPADAFVPRPGVASCLMVIIGRPDRPAVSEWPAFGGFLNAAFMNRRKKLINSLLATSSGAWDRQDLLVALDRLSLHEQVRAEELSPDELYRLFRLLRDCL